MGRRRGGNAPPSDTRPHQRRSHRRIVILAFVAVLGGLALFATRELTRPSGAARLPVLPAISAQPAAVAQHLRAKDAAARSEPRSVDAVGALCLAYHADMFFTEAEQCYTLLVDSLAPSDWAWRYYRALIQSERGGGDALVASLRHVLALAPDFGPAWLRLGDAEFKAGRYQQAEDAWRRAAAVSEPDRGSATPRHTAEVPIASYASLGLARIAVNRGTPDQSREILERVASLTPRFGAAHRLLAENYTALGRSADAERAIHHASRLPAWAPYADPMVDALARESRNSTFLLRQASEADLATNAEWSEYLARRALEVDPDNVDVLSKLGRILRTLGRNEEALDFFLLYSEKVPGDFQGLAHIGSCLSDLGRPEEAERYLRKALEGIDDSLTHYNLGVVLAATNRVAEAALEYRRALDRDPFELGARNNLAAVLVKQGQVAEATRELSRVLAIDPDNALARANLDILRSLKP
jgi:tetratricopeptide (TPR) repeat protein